MITDQIQNWYEQYKTGIYRYIFSITHDTQLAEDVLQDTFVQLLVSGICFGPGKEQAWLYKVARNKCFDILKKQKTTHEPSMPFSNSTDQKWEYMELISSLTTIEQEMVTLKIIGGFTHKEIAKITGSSVAAVKKRYERAIRKLRDGMEVHL